jgi:hypothetical protein
MSTAERMHRKAARVEMIWREKWRALALIGALRLQSVAVGAHRTTHLSRHYERGCR